MKLNSYLKQAWATLTCVRLACLKIKSVIIIIIIIIIITYIGSHPSVWHFVLKNTVSFTSCIYTIIDYATDIINYVLSDNET